MTSPLLVATRSAGKMRELRELFAAARVTITSLDEAGIPESPDEELLEEAATFEENALSKAAYFHRRTGLATVADDSGLEVAALGGAPGVRSKRWSARPGLAGQALDDANNARLMKELEGHADRRARYVCAAAYCDAGRQVVVRGEVHGLITPAPRGAHGFGYDPYFQSVELGMTFGEASASAKARVSHRARAFAALLERIEVG